MVSGFWTGIALVVLLAAALVAALRVGSGHADLDWRRKDLRDLETGDHRRPRAPWWRRLIGRG
jgi:hypothetical protein